MYDFTCSETPREGQLWRGKSFDSYVRIVAVENGTVTVQPTDVGCFAGVIEWESAPYELSTCRLQRSWRLVL